MGVEIFMETVVIVSKLVNIAFHVVAQLQNFFLRRQQLQVLLYLSEFNFVGFLAEECLCCAKAFLAVSMVVTQVK